MSSTIPLGCGILSALKSFFPGTWSREMGVTCHQDLASPDVASRQRYALSLHAALIRSSPGIRLLWVSETLHKQMCLFLRSQWEQKFWNVLLFLLWLSFFPITCHFALSTIGMKVMIKFSSAGKATLVFPLVLDNNQKWVFSPPWTKCRIEPCCQGASLYSTSNCIQDLFSSDFSPTSICGTVKPTTTTKKRTNNNNNNNNKHLSH